MPEVKYLLIDMNYYLFRARFAIGGSNRIFTAGELIGSLMLTVNKLMKATEAKKVIFSWDKAPYYKLQTLTDYKLDRVYDSDRIVELQSKLDAGGLTDEEVNSIKEELESLKISDTNFQTMQKVKYELINNSDSFGFINLMKQGIESDDWGYFFSKFLTEESDSYGVVASSDDDWQWNITKNCGWYSTKKAYQRIVDYDEQITVLTDLARSLDIPIFEYGQLLAVYYGNHNNVQPNEEFQKECSFDDLCKIYSEGNIESTPVGKYFNALNVNSYYPTFKNNIWDVLYNSSEIDVGSYWNFHRNNEVQLYPNVIKSMLRRLDRSLYGFSGLLSNLGGKDD